MKSRSADRCHSLPRCSSWRWPAWPFPVLLHLTQREKKQIIRFPSLMFVRRIPYQSVRRRKIHNWLLLMVRLAALALIIPAFARPFFAAATTLRSPAAPGAREVVVLLDQSYSMGYGDRWERARAAAHDALQRLWRVAIAARSCCFRRAPRSRCGRRRSASALTAAVDAAKPRRRCDALRAGAESGRQHPGRLAAAAPRGDADQRLPARRLARRGRRAAAAGRAC